MKKLLNWNSFFHVSLIGVWIFLLFFVGIKSFIGLVIECGTAIIILNFVFKCLKCLIKETVNEERQQR